MSLHVKSEIVSGTDFLQKLKKKEKETIVESIYLY